MEAIVITGKNSVTQKKDMNQFYFANQTSLEHAEFEIGEGFNLKILDKYTVELALAEDSTNTVSKKGSKRIIDITKVPPAWVKGMKLKVIALKGKIIVTIHHNEKLTKEREVDIINKLNENEDINIATIFSGKKMRKMLKDNGLVKMSNDLSCKLAIELEHEDLNRSLLDNNYLFQKPSLAAANDLELIDFSTTNLPNVDGVFIDANAFDIRTDKKVKRNRRCSANDDTNDDKSGMLLLSTVEIMKRTNPAFVNIHLDLPSKGLKKELYEEECEKLNILMTIFSHVLLASNYNIEQTVFEQADNDYIQLLAISKNLNLEEMLTLRKFSEPERVLASPTIPKMIEKTDYIEKKILQREDMLKHSMQNNLIVAGGAFSGDGILDRAIHEGLRAMGLDSYNKFGMEINEAYFESNLRNNSELWRDDSFFFLGDVRELNVYLKKLPYVNTLYFGVPCVGASNAGLAKNELSCAEQHEKAGALFITTLEILKSSNPAEVVIENVPNYQNSFSMTIIRSVMRTLGYSTCEDIFSGNDHGALENRKRLCLVASSKNITNGENILDILPSYAVKPNSLNDVIRPIKDSSTAWKWRDYLDAKAVKDKEDGKGFDQQHLTGEEGHCGTIGCSYQKGRSTEPFLIHPRCDEFGQLLQDIADGRDTLSNVMTTLCNDADTMQMIINFAENRAAKDNRRAKLKGSDKIQSRLATELEKIIKTNPLDTSTDFASLQVRNLTEDELIIEEFSAILTAMSKATRLFTAAEHADLKNVPQFLIEGLSETIAHEVLGNGVVFSLFAAVGRRIGASLIQNFAGQNAALLIKRTKAKEIGIDSKADVVEIKSTDSNTFNTYKVIQNVDSIYLIDTTLTTEKGVGLCFETEEPLKIAA